MRRFVITLLLASVSVAAHAAGIDDSRHERVNPVVAWNRILLSIVRTPGAQPATVHATRSFALLHTAIYDAVNSIRRTHTPYLVAFAGATRNASEEAAAHAAAHDVLIALYPSFQSSIEADFWLLLDGDRGAKDELTGLAIGREVARQILAIRGNDGAHAEPPPFVFRATPGSYQSTPPNFPPQPQFTHWRFVTPFTLPSAMQFRPGPPPALTSIEYSNALNEVELAGIANSTTATPDEALTGLFWNGAIQNYWNEIAQTVSDVRHLSTADSARLFALVNLSLADGVIAFYDAKYTYNLWRPVTAIRAADTDGNPATTVNPSWLPQTGKTAPDPSYPGAHAVLSHAAAEVLSLFIKRDRFDFDVTSEVMPGVVRSFSSFSSAAEEASLSRIFAGQHFRFDQDTGQQLGRDVAGFVFAHFLTRTDEAAMNEP
jgi:hypothetical protein